MVNSKNYTLHKNKNYALSKKNNRKYKTKECKKSFFNKKKEVVIFKLRKELFTSYLSNLVKDKFCDITGYQCVNTHNKSYLNYLNRFVFKYIKNLSTQKKKDFRELRKIKRGF